MSTRVLVPISFSVQIWGQEFNTIGNECTSNNKIYSSSLPFSIITEKEEIVRNKTFYEVFTRLINFIF